jgi:hypothetical protein
MEIHWPILTAKFLERLFRSTSVLPYCYIVDIGIFSSIIIRNYFTKIATIAILRPVVSN